VHLPMLLTSQISNTNVKQARAATKSDAMKRHQQACQPWQPHQKAGQVLQSPLTAHLHLVSNPHLAQLPAVRSVCVAPVAGNRRTCLCMTRWMCWCPSLACGNIGGRKPTLRWEQVPKATRAATLWALMVKCAMGGSKRGSLPAL